LKEGDLGVFEIGVEFCVGNSCRFEGFLMNEVFKQRAEVLEVWVLIDHLDLNRWIVEGIQSLYYCFASKRTTNNYDFFWRP
jgi:hypothetical protein